SQTATSQTATSQSGTSQLGTSQAGTRQAGTRQAAASLAAPGQPAPSQQAPRQPAASGSAATVAGMQQPAPAPPLKPADWGAPPIDVSHEGRTWVIAGRKQRVTLNESDLSTTIQASGVTWKTVPSGTRDLLVRIKGEEAWLRLAGAGSIRIVPY